MSRNPSESAPRQNRTIRLPFQQETYGETVTDDLQFRLHIDEMFPLHPELFPPGTGRGRRMKDSCISKKQDIMIRRTEISGIARTVRPSFVMPYMTGMTGDAEKGLFLRRLSVPFRGTARSSGRDPVYRERMEQSPGRNSIVGTAVKESGKLPDHVAADEKHTRIRGEKACAAAAVAEECILGVSVADSADGDSLKKDYEIYKEEARNAAPGYSPETVNADGWKAAVIAWESLFPSVTPVLCFLHMFISIRDRTKKKFGEIYREVVTRLRECCGALTGASFPQRVGRFAEWAKKNSVTSVIIDRIGKIQENISAFGTAYAFPGAHGTGNMPDRLMRMTDRRLFNTQYFQGVITSAEPGIRGWAPILNFAPSNPYTVKVHDGLQSPAERLNGFRYHDNWLHNLLISASLGQC